MIETFGAGSASCTSRSSSGAQVDEPELQLLAGLRPREHEKAVRDPSEAGAVALDVCEESIPLHGIVLGSCLQHFDRDGDSGERGAQLVRRVADDSRRTMSWRSSSVTSSIRRKLESRSSEGTPDTRRERPASRNEVVALWPGATASRAAREPSSPSSGSPVWIRSSSTRNRARSFMATTRRSQSRATTACGKRWKRRSKSSGAPGDHRPTLQKFNTSPSAARSTDGSRGSSSGRWMTTSRRAPEARKASIASASLRCPRSVGSGSRRVASQRKTSASRVSST